MNKDKINQPKLIADLQTLRNLDRALRYLEREQFPDVVAQDEFSHDILVPFAAPPHVLVLGVT
jgi:hypothetical protein